HHAYSLGFPCCGAARAHLATTLCEFRLTERHVDAALWNVDVYAITFADQPDGAALSGFGRNVSDAESAGAATEAAVGDQGASLAEAFRLQERRRVEHLLHTRTALGAFVDD